MLKQLLLIISVTILLGSFTIAQEESKKETEKVQTEEQLEVEQISVETEELISQEIWNKVCPVKGNPIEEDTPTVEYNDKLYGFCCPGCDTKFAKNPEKYSKNLSEDGSKFIGRK